MTALRQRMQEDLRLRNPGSWVAFTLSEGEM
jgi:hypothetical protein